MMRVLMCPPVHFDHPSDILDGGPTHNRWQDKVVRPDRARAIRQWYTLADTYEQLGVRVETLMPTQGLVDQVFTANVGWVHQGNAYLANYTWPSRQNETPEFRKWLSVFGRRFNLTPVEVPSEFRFEGGGDAAFIGDALVMAYGQRSDRGAAEFIASHGNITSVLALELDAESGVYHHDLGALPVPAADLYVFWPYAFTKEARDRIYSGVQANLLPVTKREAYRMCLNGQAVGRTVVMDEPTPSLRSKLEAAGVGIVINDASAFWAAGGSNRCCTLVLED